MLAEENLSKGVLYAVAACIAGAVAWGLISVSTGRQIGFMPIAIGFMVGFPYYTSYKAIVNRFFANIEVFFRATSI